MSVDHRGHGVGCVVETVHELEAEGDQQSKDQQQIGPEAANGHIAEVLGDADPNESEADHEGRENHATADHGMRFLHFLVKQC